MAGSDAEDGTERTADQVAESWSGAAHGYAEAFAPFTGLFAEAALDLLEIGPGARLLDVATGSGALAVRAAERGARVLATDFAPGMVELTRSRLAEAGVAEPEVAVMDGQALDLPDGADGDGFDAAASMFGVIFFPDIDAGLAELTRVLRPGGRALVATWKLETFRLMDLITEALARAFPDVELPSREPVWARIGTAEGVADGLVGAGLTDVRVEVVRRHLELADPAAFFRRIPDWSPPAVHLFALLDDAAVERAGDAFAEVYAEGSDGDGMPAEALLGTGRRPA